MATINASVCKHLTSIHEWRRLGEANIFPAESRLELVEGEILEMSPIGCNHSGHHIRLMYQFAKLIGQNAIISAHNPLQLGDLSEPEPDFMLLRPQADFYTRHPVAADVLLLIEISDSSLEYDQSQKLHLYAIHKIPEYWIVNLNASCLEVYLEPIGEAYAQKTTLRTGSTVNLSQLPQLTIQINDLFITSLYLLRIVGNAVTAIPAPDYADWQR